MGRKFRKIFVIAFLSIIVLCLLGFLFVNSSWGQNKILGYVTNSIANDLDVDIKFDDLEVNFFTDFTFKGFYIEDLQGDTLLFVKELRGDIASIDVESKQLAISNLKLTEPVFNLNRSEGEQIDNIQFLLDRYFSSEDKDKSERWKLSTENIEVINGRFGRRDFNKALKDKFDINHLNLSKINLVVDEIGKVNDVLRINVKHFDCVEKGGLQLKSLTSLMEIAPSEMRVNDLTLKTANSEIIVDGLFQYEAYQYFDNFISEVDLTHVIKDGSYIHTKDLGYLFSGLEGANEKIELSGKMVGTFERLKGKLLDIRFGKRSIFKGNMSFDGLPKLNTAFINFKVKELSTDYWDLNELEMPVLKKILSAMPGKVHKLGRVKFDGSFTGFVDDFVAFGNLDTDLGPVNSNIALIKNKVTDGYRIKGDVSTTSFDLKNYLENEKWGTVTANLKVDASGPTFKKLAANLEGTVDKVEYNGYNYESLAINGLLDENLFSGKLSGEEPNLGFDFSGTINLQESLPIYDFDLKLNHADPVALNLSGLTNWEEFGAEIKTTMKGNNIDDLQGNAQIQNLFIKTKRDSIRIDSIFFDAIVLDEGRRKLSIASDVADIDFTGKFKSKLIGSSLLAIMQDIMPSWYDKNHKVDKSLDLEFNLKVKDADDLVSVLAPGFSFSQGTEVYGSMNFESEKFMVRGHSDSIKWNSVDFYDMDLTAERYVDRAYLMFENKDTRLSDKIGFSENIFTAIMYNDSLESDLTWSNENLNTSGFFSTFTVFDDLTSGVMQFLPSELIINSENWQITDSYDFRFDKKEIEIENFVVENGIEKLIMNGMISNDPNKILNIDFTNFEMKNLNELVNSEKFKVEGIANVKAAIKDVYNNPTLETTLNIDDIVLMDEPLGDIAASSIWNGDTKSLDVKGSLVKDNKDILNLDGNYSPKNTDDKLDAVLSVNELDLSILKLTNAKGISDFGGMASGQLDVAGVFTEPDISGNLMLSDATVKIDFLNTTYHFSDSVIVENDWIGINQTAVYDELGNIARVNGTVGHDIYRNWNYDFFAEFDSLLCFNLKKDMNDRFYGRGFAEGNASISGYGAQLSLEVNAKSKKGTVIDIPLGDEVDVKLENFISFKNPDVIKEKLDTDLSNLDLNLNLEINRDAFIRLIFDEQIGDIMEGRGNGLITMDIDSRGEFNMIGNYIIEEGQYLFTLKNIVNKRFEVEPGGTITWFGDPYEALINIDAIYKVRASLQDFTSVENESQRTVPTNCKMELKNKLLNPDIDFEIAFPTLNPTQRNLIENQVNSELELNRQFFSLLVLNKFLPSQSSSGESDFNAIGTTVNTGFEFLANQVSNWLSQISNDVDVGLNYRPGDQITNQELAVALSTQLFNERLILTGNLGVSERNEISGNKTSLIGDFILEYMLTPEGRLRLKVFNETNDFNIATTDQAGITQGIGVVVFREFDSKLE